MGTPCPDPLGAVLCGHSALSRYLCIDRKASTIRAFAAPFLITYRASCPSESAVCRRLTPIDEFRALFRGVLNSRSFSLSLPPGH